MLNSKKIEELILPLFSAAREKWLLALTGLIIFIALLVLLVPEKLSTSASFGDFVAGFAGALAFLWLVAGYRMQVVELSLHREELKEQRIALQTQANELKSMSRFAALDQVRSMLDSALKRLSQSGTETKKPEQFLASSMPGPEWKILMESTNPEEVMDAFKIYTEKTGPVETFISSYSSAAKFYLKSSGNVTVDYKLPTHEFVFINRSWLEEVPYLSTHLYAVCQYSEIHLNYEPAHKTFMLAFLVASQKFTGKMDIVKKDSVSELKQYLDKQNKNYPAIAKT